MSTQPPQPAIVAATLTAIDPATAAPWAGPLASMRADVAFMSGRAGDARRRATVRPQLAAFIQEFCDGKVELEELRSVFDTRTRTEWDIYGLKGLSGAMFLNTLVKHLPKQRNEIAASLRELLAAPTDDNEAKRKLRSFVDYIEGLIRGGATKRAHVQVTRLGFFASALWHLADPERWPVMYPSVRDRLQEKGLFTPQADIVENYLSFARTARGLALRLGVTQAELEDLFLWLGAGDPVERKLRGLDRNIADAPLGGAPASPVGARTWLIAPGPNASMLSEFVTKKIVGIGWTELGDLNNYASFEDLRDALRKTRGADETEPTHDALACWEFARVMKPGDVVFAKRGRRVIVARGIVASDYRYDSTGGEFPHLRDVDWVWVGEGEPRSKLLVTKILTDVSDYSLLVEQLNATAGAPLNSSAAPGPIPAPKYSLDDAAKELFISRCQPTVKRTPLPPAKGTHPFVQAVVADVVPNIPALRFCFSR